MELTVADAPEHVRYEARTADGELAGILVYRTAGSAERPVIVYEHTVVEPAFEGQGVGGSLASYALDDARARGASIVPRCPFVAAYLTRHPEYADLLDPT
jgi:predicted GNAT family acetyltransferase